MDHREQKRRPRKLVLCFDGTGKQFRGDDSDSNIVKIFRMLNRTADDQYHYYQPGIGTYIDPSKLSDTSPGSRLAAPFRLARDSALGLSLGQHVIGGYRFLMRYCEPGDEIYVFGFSRGAYTARFLAEMLDFVGLLSQGNEEMVHFAWAAFSQWQRRRHPGNDPESASRERELYDFMTSFREAFTRPMRRIQFLGLFDTVNSVPQFETAWMGRSPFPYTVRTTAKVIRHAVSIDERRAKFRQDLIYQSGRHGTPSSTDTQLMSCAAVDMHRAIAPFEERLPYRMQRRRKLQPDVDTMTVETVETVGSSDNEYGAEDKVEQDILEVLFAGDHSDVGGGWDLPRGAKNASHVPLTWMVREAMRAGLMLDAEKVAAMGCADVLEHREGVTTSCNLRQNADVVPIHDSLQYHGGSSFWAVTGWRLMEYLPFRRMDLQADGTWRPIRWPLPKGEVRDIPYDALVHGSVLRRMNDDDSYRPGNLIVGGGGRGFRVAPAEYGKGKWECVAEPGDAVGELWKRTGST